jgi:hypothetical protein
MHTLQSRLLLPVLLIALLASGPCSCSSTVITVQHGAAMRANARWVLLPVSNFSETPQAGERVEAMLETLLRKDGIAALEVYPALKEDDSHLVMSERQRFDESLAWARKQGFQYAVSGSVEEWRYKSGVDGEPAVGISVRVTELGSSRVVWSASGTRSGSAGDNASGTALRLLESLVKELDVGS